MYKNVRMDVIMFTGGIYMNKNNYILGLDIGISSVGWALLAIDENHNPYKIIDVGSRIFAPGEVEKTGDSRAKERREHRGSRRVIRRREFRVDRVRNLLYEYGFLDAKIDSDKFSIISLELTGVYQKMIDNYYRNNYTNPYELKVKALDEKLSKEELAIILVHYAKKRGYKSNREEDSDGNDKGKVLCAISENVKLMEDNNYRTVSEMYIKDPKFKDRIKNGADDYKVSVTREMYEDEIKLVLDKQISFRLIDEEFKNKYLEIWSSQRHYSSGPGYYYEYVDGERIKCRSPYGGNLIEKMVGKCKFDGNPRAPKFAYSSELFVSLTRLVNFRYKVDIDDSYISLTKKEISDIIDIASTKETVKYKDLLKVLGIDNIIIKNLQLSRSDYVKVIDEVKKELKIDKDKKLNINKLNDEEKDIYNKIYNKKLLDKKFIELKGYHSLRKVFVKCFGKDEWEKVKDNVELLDELAVICTNYKLNDDIIDYIKSSPLIDDKYTDSHFVKTLPNFKEHLNLSIEIIRKLIPLMLNGMRYDEAMLQINGRFNNLDEVKEKHDLLVPISSVSDIRNQRVMRSLTQARKVINAIIKKYGKPTIINIETANELAKTRSERNEIRKYQLERMDNNDKIRQELVKSGPFDSADKISSNDLLKYRLWKEQKECCAYSQEKITIEELFSHNLVQIDHILPYSRTYNDNYLNKTLVKTKYNQDKGNRTPYEWFGKTDKWNSFESYINSLMISNKKKDNYLLKNLDFDMEREMRSQNLNDTKYISRELSSVIKAYLDVPEVNVYQGGITAKLRARWGFNRLTHSYIASNYLLPSDMKNNVNKDRDNHLHHAMDALVIAAITPALSQRVSLYEKYNRYIDHLTEKEIKNLDYDKYNEINKEQETFINSKTGAIYEKLEDYIKEQIMDENIVYGKHNIAKLKFPVPYDDFVDEAKIRVYEQDLNRMKEELSTFKTYTKKDINNLKVLTPSFAKTKLSGKLHEETYYGMTKDKKYKTLRTPIEKVKRKDLENLPGKDAGNKDIYNAIVNWLGDCEIGAEALKKHNGQYPVNPNDKQKKEIKKIKLYFPYKNTGHMVNGSNVEKGGVYQIDVLRSKNTEDGKLYFVAYDLFDIKQRDRSKENNSVNFDVKIEYAQGDNYVLTSYQQMLKEYDIILRLNKNDLIKIVNKNNEYVIGYVVGLSSGMLEVKSKIGDGYDLRGEGKIFKDQRSRYTITVSTIKSIDKLSINILGEIHGL